MLKNPLRRGRNNARLQNKGGVFVHHPRLPGRFIQMPGMRNKPVPFRTELRLLDPKNAVQVE